MGAQALLPTDEESVAAIREVIEAFRKGWESLDADQVLSTIARHDDLVLYGTDQAEQWIGFDALVAPFRTMVKEMGNPVYTWGQDEPRIWARGDVGWACGVLELKFEDKGEPRLLPMRSTFVVARLDGRWSIAHAHFSVGQ